MIRITVGDVSVDIRGERYKVMHDRRLWTFAAEEWHRLYKDYVPMRMGYLYQQVEFDVGTITHTVPYARRMYYGEGFKFNRNTGHPKASAKWDQAAAPTQLPKLAASMQAYIDQGRLDLE